ncbi:MAG: ComEA family DNA-binding protein [Cyclobacteriaceae bacterium]
MGLRKQIGNFFGFTRAQVNAFLILLPLLIVFIFSEPVYRWVNRDADHEDWEKLDSFLAIWQAEAGREKEDQPGSELPTLFRFNPNTVTHTELLALGFSHRLAGQLISYRNEGGRFRSVHDLLKLYAIDTALYNRIAPYVVIPEANSSVPGQGSYKRPVEVIKAPFDLNLADTTQFISIRGIGRVLSKRIVKYREALGGFVDKKQLFEVYGMDSTGVRQLTEQSYIQPGFKPRAINLNRAGEMELAAHPYISKAMARAIVTYRFQHGRFRSADDLDELKTIPLESLHRIKPYLSLE